MLQRGDLHGAVALTTEAEPHAERAGDDGRAPSWRPSRRS